MADSAKQSMPAMPAETRDLLIACKERIVSLANASTESARTHAVALATAKAEADSRVRLATERERALLLQLERAEQR